MYKFKEEILINSEFPNTQKKMAEIIGISESYFSKILNGRRFCSKVLAYSITKILNPNKEIEDFFERIKR